MSRSRKALWSSGISRIALCYFVLVFFVLSALQLPRFSYVCSICTCLVLSVSSSSSCLGWAAACDYGTPWTFLLPFFFVVVYDIIKSYAKKIHMRTIGHDLLKVNMS